MWSWTNEGQQYFYDRWDLVRIRVESEAWAAPPTTASDQSDENAVVSKSPYSITVDRTPLLSHMILILVGFNDGLISGASPLVVVHRFYLVSIVFLINIRGCAFDNESLHKVHAISTEKQSLTV